MYMCIFRKTMQAVVAASKKEKEALLGTGTSGGMKPIVPYVIIQPGSVV